MSEEQREKLIPSPKEDDKETPAPLYLGFHDRINMEYFRNVIQTPSQRYQPTPLKDLLVGTTEQTVKLDYVYFPLKLVKTQRRENKVSMQRIEDGKVSFALDFQTTEKKDDVVGISVSVKRTNELNYNVKSIGCVPIPNIELSHIQESKILVKLDLDSVHMHNGKKIYELDRNKEGENMFHLVIDIKFSSGDTIKQNTRSFKLIGKRCAPVGNKRTYSDSNSPNGGKQLFSDSNSPSSPDSGLENNVSHAVSITSDVDSPGYGSLPSVQTPCHDDSVGLIEARMIVAEHIKTKFLDLDGNMINLGKAITTPNGDIAYHFLLENDDDVFEEGEIVGFVPDDHSDKKQVITKLTFKSASRAILKGVITRSPYLEAQKPSPGVRSETIAMMGIVPVQVRGPVCANEALYASPHHPGFAISASQIDSWSLNEAAFIGYAFSGRKTDDNQSAGMVQAAVSVLQSAGQRLLSEKIQKLEEHFEERIVNISRFGKRTRRCVCIGGLVVGLIIVLVSVLLWQMFVPGSALRYHMCEVGRKVPYGQAYFTFQSYRDIHVNSRVNGIEFAFDALMGKSGHIYQRLNGTGMRYYLNLDRCAYGYVTKGDIPRGIKPVRGPTVFVVDEKCFRCYYFDEYSATWTKYNSTSWELYRNLCCEPRTKWKTCEEINESLCRSNSDCNR